MAKEFLEIKKQDVFVVHNGFDHEDYDADRPVILDEQFTISYFGVVPPSRNCPKLWLGIKKLVEADPIIASKLKVVFYGQVDNSVIEEVNKLGIQNYFDFNGFISHEKATELQRKTQVLLLLVNNTHNASGIVTGKVFEYFAAKRPILAVGPIGGDLDELLTETNSGIMLPFDDEVQLFEGLKSLYEDYKKNWVAFNPKNSDIYSRKELTNKMVGIMNRIILKTSK